MTESINQRNKQLVWEYWAELQASRPDDIATTTARYCSDGHRWRGHDPVGDLDGIDALSAGFWQPMLSSIPDLERKTWIFFGGESSGRIDGGEDGRMWVTGTCHGPII